MKMEPKPQKEISQDQNPTADKDDTHVEQRIIPTMKNAKKAKPESRGIGKVRGE